MICPECGTELPDKANFCLTCGHDLSKSQKANLAHFNTPQSYTPKHLVDKILTSKSAIEGERKLVTVMFADVTGFTAMSEKLDPEEIHQIMDGCFRALMDEIHKCEGTVNEFRGDGVMALFGAPIAHEDHAQRACYASLGIQRALVPFSENIKRDYGIDFKMRIGLNSGPVVVGAIGDDLRMDYTAQGDTTNLAARMESSAEPGSVLVSEHTYRIARQFFEFEPLGKIQVKGKDHPVEAYWLKEKSRFRSEREIYSEMVGRDSELFQLEFQVMKAIKGEGSVVNVVGEAGIGKSRLIAELKKRDVVKRVVLLEGRAISMGQNLSFHLVLDLLKNWARIREDDAEAIALSKLESAIRRVCSDETDEIFPFVATMMGMKLSGKPADRVVGIQGESLEKLIFKNVKELLIRSTAIAPIVIVIEDLHWADASSMLLLDSLYRLALTHKVLFINVFRPGYWRSDDSKIETLKQRTPDLSVVEIVIEPLDKQNSDVLINNMLNIKGLHHGVKGQIIERAGGNPFFIEEVVRSLIDEGAVVVGDAGFEVTEKIHAVVIPPTINDVLMARIDRLDEETRNVVKVASVIGRSFFYRILTHVVSQVDGLDEKLEYLKQAQLIRERMRMHEREYVFKHVLIQEVAYNSLLKNVRLEIHERIGLAMEKLFEGRLSEFCETVAFHFKQGRSPHKAIKHLMNAGEKSVNRFAVEESHKYYREAFELLTCNPNKNEDEQRLLIDLLIQWGTVIYYRGGFSLFEDLLEAHVGLAVSLNDKTRLGMFYAWLGWAKFWRAKSMEARSVLKKALKIGEEIQDQRVIGYASCWLAFACFELGLFTEAETCAAKALRSAQLLPLDQYLSAKPLTALGWIHYLKGHGQKVLAAATNLLELGRKHENVRSTVMGHIAAGLGHLTSGDFSLAIEGFQRAVETTEDPLYKTYALACLSFGYLATQQFELAIEAAQEVVDYSNEAGTEVMGTHCAIVLAAASIAGGHMTQGFKQLKDLSRAFWADGRKPVHAVAEHTLGSIYLQIALREGDMNLTVIFKNIGFLVKNVPMAAIKAEQHFRRAIEVASEVGMRGLAGESYLGLGRLHHAKRRDEKARMSVSQAIEYFEACEASAFLSRAREVLKSLRC